MFKSVILRSRSFVALLFILLLGVLVYAAAPTITLTSPTNNTQYTGNISISATTDIAANLTINITSASGLVVQFSSNDATTHAVTWQTANGSFSDGVYNVTIVGFNSTNASDVATTVLITNITVDNSAPLFTVNTPSSSTSRSNNVTINATVTDATTAVTSVLFDITNSSGSIIAWLNATKAGDTWSSIWQTNNGSFPDGVYTLSINATNSVGKSNYTATMVSSLTVDNVIPAISSVGSGSINESSATISWTTGESANSSLQYGTGLDLGSFNTSSSLVTSHSLKIAGLSAVTLYYYNVSSCDQAGNCNTTGSFNFTTTNISSSTTTTQSSSTSTSSTTVTVPSDVVSAEKKISLE